MFALLLAPLAMSGCGWWSPLGLHHHPPAGAVVALVENPLYTPVADREFVWNQVVDTIDNYFHHKHPRRWEFCLAHNELLRLASTLQILHYDEGGHAEGQTSEPMYTAQLLAYKPLRGGPMT